MEGFTKIGDIWVENKIFSTYFSCDYEKCHGACCWATVEDIELDGGSVMPDEAKEIREKKAILATYCSQEYKARAITKPLYIRGAKHFTSLAEDGSCIYVNKDKGTCACKLAHEDGKLSFDIPKFCHLYPLWIFVENGETYLRLIDTFEEFCEPAFEKGEKDQTKVFEFCRTAIIRFFGEDFYEDLVICAAKQL